MFPANNVWNTPVDTLPVHPNSAAYISSIGPSTGLHPDFGGGLWDGAPIGIPYVLVPGTQPKVPITFDYADESDPGPYPIPPNPPIEGGASSTGDRHVLVVDTTNCVLYETWSSYPQPGGSWHAGSGAKFALTGNALRPADWTSADAAGLPILPGLVRYDEVVAGAINHAIRFTIQHTQNTYLWPARHQASSNSSASVPPMGTRFRLKAAFDVASFSPNVRVILTAMKKYGIIVADNGSNWYISGVPDDRWSNDDLATLGQVKGSSFEAVDESGLMVTADSGQATQPNGTTLSAVTLNPAAVTGGQSTTGNSVAMIGPAPTGGALVTLSSSNLSVASVPVSVPIAAGFTSAQFAVTTSPVAMTTEATIAASFGGVTRTAVLTVNPAAALSSFTIAPALVAGGVFTTGTVKLSAAAPTGGAVVTLGSNSTAATVPASVTVAAGATSATFSVTTKTVVADTPVIVSAGYAGKTLTANVTVTAAVVAALANVAVAPVSVAGGVGAVGTATLVSAAPKGGATVTLASSSASVTVPASLTVAEGRTSSTFAVGTKPVGASVTATLTATLAGASKSATLTVSPAALSSVTVTKNSQHSSIATGAVRLNGAAASAAVIALSSSNPNAASVPATVTIPAGAISASFVVTFLSVKSNTQITISATYNGVTKTSQAQATPSATHHFSGPGDRE
jgi:hypothetical protein